MKELKQSVNQYNIDELVPKRLIIQFKENEIDNQIIVNYDSLSDEQKAIFDQYQSLCNILMQS
jgi:hypothetical protein